MGTDNLPHQSGWRPPPEPLPRIKVPLGSWMSRARCADVPDPEIFFLPRSPSETSAAKALCEACPVRRECLQHALRTPEVDGVWGGLDEKEREDILQRRRTAAAKRRDAAAAKRRGAS